MTMLAKEDAKKRKIGTQIRGSYFQTAATEFPVWVVNCQIKMFTRERFKITN
jgi:hypothetical protein